MVDKALGGAGLRGQTAGETALCTVGKTGTGLTYRGYDISDLAANTSFEEVAHLILHGELPSAGELADFAKRLRAQRGLPAPLREVLERIPASAHPMDVMRTGASMLGNLEPEGDFSNQVKAAERLVAALPSIIIYWYRFSHDGVRIETQSDAPSTAEHFLTMLHDSTDSELSINVLDTSLILYAEHEFNASTFTARVCASTLSDMHSCVTGAIGSLRGHLHGGANEAAMALIERFSSPEAAVEGVRGMLERKELIMGFGHAIYRTSDPRNTVIKAHALELATQSGERLYYDISAVIEKLMWDEKELFANADFFHASAYHSMRIPTKLFTPIFVCSRVTGWSAHVMEQRAKNRIIRPSAAYVGPEPRRVAPISER